VFRGYVIVEAGLGRRVLVDRDRVLELFVLSTGRNTEGREIIDDVTREARGTR
jgi:hypothetical protein